MTCHQVYDALQQIGIADDTHLGTRWTCPWGVYGALVFFSCSAIGEGGLLGFQIPGPLFPDCPIKVQLELDGKSRLKSLQLA